MNNLINNDSGISGIFRCKLIDDEKIRAYIPGIHAINPFDDNGQIKEDIDVTSYPEIQWCCYNTESTEVSNVIGPAYVMFENGDLKRPVCISYTVIGGSGYSNGKYVGNGTTGNDIGDKIFNYLIEELGYNISVACGILGNLKVESNFEVGAWNPDDNGSPSGGLVQWHGDRLTNLETRAGKDWKNSLDKQLEFMKYELTEGNYKHVHDELLKITDESYKSTYDAAVIWGRKYEIFAGNENIGSYDTLYAKYQSYNGETSAYKSTGDFRIMWAFHYFDCFKNGKIEKGKYVRNVSISASGYMWPLPGFNNVSPDNKFKTKARPNHLGIDISGVNVEADVTNENIVATRDGKISINQYDKDGYGYWIEIDHGDGIKSRYAHMIKQSSLSVGTVVKQGDVIGHVGSTGKSSGPHLHFEILENGTQVNPENYVTIPQS